MSQTITEGTRLESGSTGKIMNVGLWILQIGAAGMFLMVGAVVTHVFVVGGSPLQAIILLIVTGVVAWGRRKRTMNFLAEIR